ncbi:MAG: SagB/ThcOx family dehydrogenase [Candidatus Woesebacteria bacterium]|nr:SagB/ThcOx family dehydrogenase [Candidatus Woesebacteria bacterium]
MTKINDKIESLIESVEGLSNSRKFHISTNIDDFMAFKKTPRESWPLEWKKVYHKAYPRFDQQILPSPTTIKIDLEKTILKRKSFRNFSGMDIDLNNFSDLIYYSAGIKDFSISGEKRNYPSGGARYPLEIYPIVFNVEKIKKGIYHYHVKTHSLECILEDISKEKVLNQFDQLWIKKSALLFVITAVFDRTEIKYQDRGYRHILTEYGHMAQNLYLMGTGLGLGVCSIGGFNDNGINELLDIDGLDESVVGVVAVGTKTKIG